MEGRLDLNPDAEPYPDALKQLIDRAVAGNKAMVGTIHLKPAKPMSFDFEAAFDGIV